MNKLFKKLFYLCAVFAFVASCTDAPSNDIDSKTIPVNPNIGLNTDGPNKSFDSVIINSPEVFSAPGETTGELSEAEQQLKKENLSKPIIYGVGAAGITLDTTFADSKNLLTPPFRGPFSNGVTFYNEELIVVWKNDGDRKPQIILASKGYLGKMKIGGKFGDITFQTKFLDYKGDDPIQGAAQLTVDLYNELENVEDKSYNCLADRNCQLIYGTPDQANMVLVFPGAVFLMAKEEWQMAEIRIIRNVEPGILANNVDLINGDVLIPNEEPIKLGQTNEEIFARLDAGPVKSNPETFVRTDTIGYSWRGFWYSFHRSNYGLDVIKAEPSDVTKTISLSSEFPAYFTIGGKRILMTQSPSSISFALETDPNSESAQQDIISIGADKAEYKLKMSTKVLKANSINFVEGLANFLRLELLKTYETVNFQMYGFQDDEKINKEISGVITAYNKSSLDGVSIVYQVNEEQESIAFMQISDMNTSLYGFDNIILPQVNEPIARRTVEVPVLNVITGQPVINPATGQPLMTTEKLNFYDSLMGIQLNDLVRLTEVDALGRQEATVEMPLVESVTKERSSYVEQGIFEVPDTSANGRLIPRDQGYVSVGSQTVSMGIQVIGQDAEGLLARVVSVTTNSSFGVLNDVCDLDNLNLKIGMTTDQVVASLDEAIERKRMLDSSFECEQIKIQDDGNQGKLKEIYFPKERLVLYFSSKTFAAMAIYLPLNQVDTTIPGGN